MTCYFVAILMMYRSGRSGRHCGPIMMTRYGFCHLYEVCCSTVRTEGGRNIHKSNRNYYSSKGYTELSQHLCELRQVLRTRWSHEHGGSRSRQGPASF